MPITSSIDRYKCDRCPKEVYFESSDKGKADWQPIDRNDTNRVKKSYLFCPTCFEAWKVHQAAEDNNFTAFMKGVS